MKHLALLLLLISSSSILAQNRLFVRSGENIGRTRILDIGNGESHWLIEQRFGFDSTHIHLLHMDADLQMEHLAGFRTWAPLGWMNTAALVDDDVIVAGASLGFTTIPYVLRMDESGDVPWAYYFSNLQDGNTQILEAFANDNKLDLFTWSDNTRSHFYMINGSVAGSFPPALKVDAPVETEIRTDEIAQVSADREYLAICQGDTNNTFSKFLFVMHLDTNGLISGMMHDHDQSMNLESESAFGLIPTSDGNWVYTCTYNIAGDGLKNRLVKMQIDGAVIWSKEYFLDGEQLSIGACHETSNGDLLFSSASFEDQFFVKVNAQGDVISSHIYAQSLSSVIPSGWFFENDQEQLYAWNNAAITEMDENINVCDMQPHSGIVAVDAPFNTHPVTANTSTIVPGAVEFMHYSRTGSYELLLDCQSVGLEDAKTFEFELFPNPARDVIQVSLPNDRTVKAVEIVDMFGRVVSLVQFNIAQHYPRIDINGLVPGTYFLRLHTHEGITAQKAFVKL